MAQYIEQLGGDSWGSGFSSCPFAAVSGIGKVTVSLCLGLLINKAAHDYADSPRFHRMLFTSTNDAHSI